jgi:putative restriction endonuclease
MSAGDQMKFYIAITDNQWYKNLSQLEPDEVNFWKPGGRTSFSAIPAGAPFLFKLHSPENFIAGGGWFLKYEAFPMSIVWEAFQEKNGAPDFVTFANMIRKHRQNFTHDPVIGCIILMKPFFFHREDWIPPPENFSPYIQQGKTYNTNEPIGRKIWDAVLERLYRVRSLNKKISQVATVNEQRFGADYLAHNRLEQGAFRICVTSAYQRRCAITGEKALPALEAGHIKPFSKSGPSQVKNGILLRADIHRLFDKGYMTITTEHKVEVSRAIKEEFQNGRDYYKYHGNSLLILPYQDWERPGEEYLAWHNEEVFIG